MSAIKPEAELFRLVSEIAQGLSTKDFKPFAKGGRIKRKSIKEENLKDLKYVTL